MKTYYGIKNGMSQVWTKSGLRLPVTVIKIEPMTVTQVKTVETDGYSALQIGIGSRREITMTKPQIQHLKKSGTTSRTVKEIRLSETSTAAVGDKIAVTEVLKVGDIVKITGTTKGHGFTGPVKRWGFKGGPKTHGQSDRWRAPGSIGQGTTPGRINKGKHMAGRMGDENFAVRNLMVVKIDEPKQEIWVSGPIPGKSNGVVSIEFTKEGKFEGLRDTA